MRAGQRAAAQNEHIVFIHFSARFSVEQIEEQLDAQLPAHLRRRVTPLLAGFSGSSARAVGAAHDVLAGMSA
jgi:hypothetical protein